MHVVTLKPTEPIRSHVTKFGGQPIWLSGAQWPIGRTDGEPMRFLCQVQLPEGLQFGGQRMAYVFMSDADGAETWGPDAGDNAVVLQPAPFDAIVSLAAIDNGPTLEVMRPGVTGNRLVPVETEYRVDLDELPDELISDDEYRLTTHIAGLPGWLQNEEYPGDGWRLIIQVDSTTELYSVNFGDAGVGYAFIAPDGRQARFLWQCC